VIDGEGVFGLRRGFRIAGAHSVIMSLWPVADATTAEWMLALYRARFAQKSDTAKAIHDTTLAALAARRAAGLSTHPYYWASFIAAGDWR
jgi:CHAT domain-containing protein